MTEAGTWLAIIDDDPALRSAISYMCDSADIPVEAFGSATAFLSSFRPDRPVCLLVDFLMPRFDGLELQQQVLQYAPHAVIIMLTGHAGVPLVRESMRYGAWDFIEKPYDEAELLEKIRRGLALAKSRYQDQRATIEAVELLSVLTQRERQVFDLVVEGHVNKVIADRLDLSVKTVEVHRSRMMVKLGATTFHDILALSKAAESGRRKPDLKT